MTRAEAAGISCALMTFVAFGTLSAIWSACGDCDDCDCPDFPARPPASAELRSLQVDVMRADAGALLDGAVIEVQPEAGTLRVTGDTVIITYRQGGQDHRVVYDVVERP